MTEEAEQNPGAPKRDARLPAPVTADWLFRAAAHYLERYSSSVANLERVLERKVMRRARLRGEDPADFSELVRATARRFVDLELLDDRRFAEAKLAGLRRRGASSRLIAAKLASKGVDREIIEATMQADETPEVEAARALARRRRLGPYRTQGRAERRDKDIAALMRSGFGFGVARAAVDDDPDEPV